jgi:hypothetical protein
MILAPAVGFIVLISSICSCDGSTCEIYSSPTSSISNSDIGFGAVIYYSEYFSMMPAITIPLTQPFE